MASLRFIVFMASIVSVFSSERIEYDTETFESSKFSSSFSSSSFVESESFSDQNFENSESFHSSCDEHAEALSESFSSFASNSNTYKGGCGPTRPPNIIICGPDEEFNGCANGGCGRWNCSQPGIICIDLIEGGCEPGCRCKEPLLRRDDGKCVPSDQCPPQCGLNEEYVECKDTVCRPNSCTDLRFPLPCRQSISDRTEKTTCEQGPGCVCKEGYVKDSSGSCIPENQCPPNITCGPDEVFDGCVNGGCGRWNCSQPGVICIDLIEGGCEPGCRCKEPLLRTDDGKCVPSDQCPSPCGVNEEYVDNPVCRAQTCSDLGFPLPCLEDESSNQGPGCVCMQGYVRDADGNCISDKECPSCGGDPNATSGCGTFCTTCDNYGQDVACILSCELNGCACKEGYIYDEKSKKCVLPKNCPPKTCNKPNEVLGCLNRCGTLRCDTRFKMLFKCPPPPKNCTQGCVCKPGYYKTNDGRCVTHEECPPNIICGPDEEYTDCINGGCGRWNCSQPGIICIDPIKGGCRPGCRCKEPLLRTDDGRCVPSDQCPVKCPGENTEYACPKGCLAQICENIGKKVFCPLIKTTPNCTKECRCTDGYYKNKIGECISEKQCLQCNGPHEYFSCGKECDNVCATLSVQNQTNCPYDNIVCNPMCYCEEGYARDANNTCIPIKNCPAQCGKNEEYVDKPVCRPKTCSDLGFPLACMQVGAEVTSNQGPGCVCMEGYVRDANGNCISDNECPSCGGDPNATTGCGTFCTTCDNYGQDVACILLCELNGCACKEGYIYDEKSKKCVLPENCPPKTCNKPNEVLGCLNRCGTLKCDTRFKMLFKCPPPPKDCEPGCVCKPGYYKTNDGRCVTQEECPPNIICGPDEEYTSCINSGCGRWNCSQPGIICIDPIKGSCRPGCRCKKPLLRTDDGKCVPSDQCPVKCPGENTEYACPKGCAAQICENVGKKFHCPLIKTTPNCTKECRCKDGYYKNKIGECISEKQCLQCNGPHEYFSCGKECDNVCATLSVQNQTNCPYDNIVCSPMCYCEEGYARDANNTCIPIKNCPAQCGKNEEYVDKPVCRPKTCSDLGFPLPCMKVGAEVTSNQGPGCVCMEGYVRDANGNCISDKECPSCGGDPNATTGCGTFCTTCDNYGQDVACIALCELNGCACKKGYIYDEKSKKCVLPENCPPKTCNKPNEVLGCINQCGTLTCDSRYEMLFKCPPPPKNCTQGCVCKPGYYKTSDGRCVTKEECPVKCFGENTEYACPKGCLPQICENIEKRVPCPLIRPGQNCTKECRCKDGYYKNKIGECISEKQCNQCKGANEYFSCGGACDNVCATLNVQNQTNCPIRNIVCNRMCYCEKGYARDAYNICIPIEKCPAQCGVNEEYVDSPVCRPKTCSDLGFDLPCMKVGAEVRSNQGPGCVCMEGYVRDANGNCISDKECPSCGGDPNATAGCGTFCTTCENYGQEVACILLCKLNGCACKEGFIYDGKSKKCVLPENCPAKTCNEPNEMQGCKNACPPRTCEAKDRVYKCLPSPQVCYPDCVCKPGFYRNKNGDCVTKEQCSAPICTGKNEVLGPAVACPPQTCEGILVLCPARNESLSKTLECRCKPGYFRNKLNECISREECDQCRGPNEFFSCGGACDNVCATLNVQNQTNCPIRNIVCNRMCYCEKGYARDAYNICIPIEKCPAQCGVNEEYVDSSVCRPETCSDVGFPLPCMEAGAESSCNQGPGCVCMQGYVRDANGNCISDKECPSCGGDPNAEAGCGTFCTTCDTYGHPVACKKMCRVNSCECKEGFIYDADNKKCVLPENCPKKCNKPNEVLGCKNPCPLLTCATRLQRLYKCPPRSKICEPDCVCKPGFYRNKDGACVTEAECSPPKCGKNEVYEVAVPCPPQTCESIYARYNCPEMNITSPTEYECRCKSGYLKNKNKECITLKECEKCKGPNEYFSCAGACDNVCSTLSVQNQTNCPIRNKKCNPMCYCDKGFARDANNICIPIEDCPAQCKKNEEFVECPDSVCRPAKCTDVGFPVACPSFSQCPSKPGCVCSVGYVKHENGTCIPAKECPSCGGDKNAVVGCGVNCNRRCFGNTKICPRICRFNGCDCKPGYLLDANLNKCVLPEKCTAACGANEIYSTCTNRACHRNNCAQLSIPWVCRPIAIHSTKPDPSCKGGCECISGYLRDSNNTCIPQEQCPEANTCGPNEIYSTCVNRACHSVNCSQASIAWSCLPIAINSTKPDPSCKRGCECISGYLRDSNNTCIPLEQCPEANTNTTGNPDDNEESQLIDGNGIWTAKFLYDSAMNNPGKSVVASPFSVLFLLAQLALFTTGVAAEQLYALLNLKNPQQIRGTIPPFLKSFNSERNITLALAEKVFGSENYPFSERFKAVTKNLFMSEAQNLDFSKPEEAAKIINDWVASKTNNLIQNLVPASSLSASTRLVLANAIYFKGNWSKIFKKSNTKSKDFYVSDTKTVKVQMMNQLNTFRYGVTPKSNSQVIELPYINENCTFLVLLPPKTADGLNNLLKEQLNFSSIRSVIGKLSSTKVDLSLPAFKTETSTDLEDILKKSNVTQIFNPQGSGLSGILAKPEKLFVSSAVQKAGIIVTETGAEAAAANAITVGATAVLQPPKPPISFNADHNFLYYILYKGIPIFCGLFAGPQ